MWGLQIENFKILYIFFYTHFLRDGEWTPRLLCVLCLLLLLLLLLMFLLWTIFSWLFLSKSFYTFYLYPPVCDECVKRNPSLSQSYRSPSKLYVHLYSPAQAHFELNGNLPLRSNSFTAIDLDTVTLGKFDIELLSNNLGLHCHSRSCSNQRKWKAHRVFHNGTRQECNSRYEHAGLLTKKHLFRGNKS